METQLTIRLPRKLHSDLKAAALRLRRSRSDLVRLALEAWLAGGTGTAGVEKTPWELVSDLVGSVESGRADLGTSHREHVLDRVRESRARWQES